MIPKDCAHPGPRNLNANRPFKKSNKTPLFHDWRDYGLISPVKNQGSYGSSWAYSSVGTL